MKTVNHTLYSVAALLIIASGVFTTPAAADMEVVAVMAMQTRLADNTEVFRLDANKKRLARTFTEQLNHDLTDRLADEFESAQRAALLASEFTEQILDALDERLPGEVGNLITAVN